MTTATIYTRAQQGINAPLVTVEAHISNGLPSFSIVGLPEASVRESKERVRSALLNTNFEFPIRRITINLAPADLPKEGSRFDLPIALSILIASQQISAERLKQYEFAGELSLSGELRSITGLIPLALATKSAQRKLIIPYQNSEEASLIQNLEVFPAQHISEVFAHLIGQREISPYQKCFLPSSSQHSLDMEDIQGQHHAKRALEIAVAGQHSLLLIGPPGTGKTMLATRAPTILPSLTDEEAIEIAAIGSISHQGFNANHWKKRPFRAPHHSASSIALVGGGNPPKPGEISLAHHGILFLDELPEFNRHVLEALREPLESGTITISRAARQSEFPASFQLIAAMNPCPCGYLGDTSGHCRCTPDQVQRYRAKISGPVLDRIDLFAEVPRLPTVTLIKKQSEENSLSIKQRVEKAYTRQLTRAGKPNSKLTTKEIKKLIYLSGAEEQLLQQAIQRLHLTARSYYRVLKTSLTIADLEDKDQLTKTHLLEALSLRRWKD